MGKRKRGNGEGSIYRRMDGRWVGQYLPRTDSAKYRYIYGKTRAEVAEKLAKAIADRSSGFVVEAGKTTVKEYLDGWLADSLGGTVRMSTRERHEINIRVHINPAMGA